MTPTPTPICYNCAHCLTCFMRIELTRTIQSFKLLAENSDEVKRTSATMRVPDIYCTVAQTCTVWALAKDHS